MAMERLGKGLSPGADERVGEDDSSRNLGAAINPIGIAGDGVNTARTVKPFGQAEQEIDVAPASAKGAPVTGNRHGGLAPRQQDKWPRPGRKFLLQPERGVG